MMAHGGQAQVAGNPVNVVLVGHSYVQRLSEYAGQSPTTAHLGISDIWIMYYCQGGMTLWPSKVDAGISKTIRQSGVLEIWQLSSFTLGKTTWMKMSQLMRL